MTPTLDRNEFDLATNELVVTFGYINEYQDQVVPLGGANFFIPGPINKGQPTYYLFGTHHNVFTVRQSTAQFDTLSWTLGVGNVVARKSEATAYVDTDASFTQTSDAHTFPIYHGKANSSYTLTGAASPRRTPRRWMQGRSSTSTAVHSPRPRSRPMPLPPSA